MAKTAFDVLRHRLEKVKEVREQTLLSGEVSNMEHYKLVFGIKFGIDVALFEIDELERQLRSGNDEELDEE